MSEFSMVTLHFFLSEMFETLMQVGGYYSSFTNSVESITHSDFWWILWKSVVPEIEM